MEAFLVILIFAAAFVVLVTVSATFSVIGQGKRLSIERYRPDDRSLAVLVETARAHNTWAANNGFEFEGCYKVLMGQSAASMVVWRRSDRPTVLCFYLITVGTKQKTATDIVTDFADYISLTSNNSRDAQFSPARPGRYMQTFSPVTLDELWAKHIEAENYLMDAGRAQLVQKEFIIEKEFIDSCRRQNAYTRSIPLWYLKGAYWYLIRRNIRHNKSVKQQHEKKMIKLPNEFSAAEIEISRQQV
jgi:hypothetical protein